MDNKIKVKHINPESVTTEKYIFFGFSSDCAEIVTHWVLQLSLLIVMMTVLTTHLSIECGIIKSSQLRKHEWNVWGNYVLVYDANDGDKDLIDWPVCANMC